MLKKSIRLLFDLLLSELLLIKAKDFFLIYNCTVEGSLFILEQIRVHVLVFVLSICKLVFMIKIFFNWKNYSI